MVVNQGLRLAGLGVVIGVALALGCGRLLETQLFGVSVTDPMTYAIVAGLLSAVTLCACWIPARRALQVDPMVALHYE